MFAYGCAPTYEKGSARAHSAARLRAAHSGVGAVCGFAGIDNIDVVAIDSSGQTEIKNVGEYELLLVTFDNVESIDLVRPIIRAAWIGEGAQFFEVGRWAHREGFLAALNGSTGTSLEVGGSVESKPLAVSRVRELS